ncbi:MAG: hypothetical protein KDD42_04940, partial [Bdellovibrionales bacterium]|nr:hypothetical protein [Bdellovibrionales bacterium]
MRGSADNLSSDNNDIRSKVVPIDSLRQRDEERYESLERQIKDLRRHNQVLQEAFDGVLGSFSWRVTAPL